MALAIASTPMVSIAVHARVVFRATPLVAACTFLCNKHGACCSRSHHAFEQQDVDYNQNLRITSGQSGNLAFQYFTP